ncbi:hypothetical protein K501DRAFT_217057, partial [Backusella circina FSU 941]
MTSEERFAGTYRKLFDTIERGVQQCSTDRLQTILEEKKDQLLLGLEAFTEPSTQARTKVKSANSLNDEEKEFIYKLSDLFQLNEAQVVLLWEAFKQDNKVPQKGLCEDQDLITRMLLFYYEDRISFLECIGSLQRIATNTDHPYASIAADIKNAFLNDSAFIQRLISQFSKLTRSSVPNAIHTFSGWSIIWAKQCLKEEKGLLQILLLLGLTRPFHPNFTLSIIQEFEATRFGQLQTLGYLLDEEGYALRQQVSYISSLLAVNSCLSVGNMTDSEPLLIKSPEIISKINQISLYMGQSSADSLYLLAWSYFLCQVEEQLNSSRAPLLDYNSVESALHGQQRVTTDVLIDRPVTCEEGLSNKADRVVSIHQTASVYTVFMGRALTLDVFGVLGEIAASSLCDDDDVNSSGYRFVLAQLLRAFLTISGPSYIPDESYKRLVQAYTLVYSGEGELCDMFWKDDAESREQSSLLMGARAHFPYDFGNFVSILSALSGSSDSGDAANNVYDFITTISSLSVLVHKSAGLEESTIDGRTVMHVVRPIVVVPAVGNLCGIEIPVGSTGIVITKISEEKQVIRFNVSYSGWHLLTSILYQSISDIKNTTTDIYTIQSEELSGNNSDTVLSILNLFHRVIQYNPQLGLTLVQHIEEVQVIKKDDRPLLISILCGFLSRCSKSPTSIQLMVGALNCLVALLPQHPEHIWSYLVNSPIIPQVDSSESEVRQYIYNAESTSGRYPFLLSFLDLVAALVEDTQRRGWKSPDQAHLNIIHQCLRYLMLDVLPSYSGWAYKQFSERLLIGTKILDIFIDIGQSFKQPDTLGEIRKSLFENYLYDGGFYYTSHLLDNISEGATMANTLYKFNYPAEAGRVEKLTEKSFIFICLLLQYRLESINTDDHRKSNLLERLILERTKGTDCSDFLLQIAKYIDYRHNIQLSIQATRVISLLCKAVSYWENVPNFVQYLGSTEEAHSVIRSYLAVAKDQFQDELLLASIWQLLTLLLETQPSLAILFLDCGDFIMPSPKSAVHRQIGGGSTAKKPEPVPANTDSAISAAIDLLGEWHQLSRSKPAVLSSTLQFLSTFWQTAFDHYAIVERTRTDLSLWGSLERILLCPSEDTYIPDYNALLDNEAIAESDQNKSVRRICCLNLSKAFALRLLSLEIHIIAGSQRNGSVADKLPVGLKSLLTKISDPATLNTIRQNAIQNGFDGDNIQELQRTAQRLSTYSFDELLYKVQSVDLGHYGSPNQVGQYGYSYLYDFPIIHDRVRYVYGTSEVGEDEYLVMKYDFNHFLSCVCKVNSNGSIAESDTILLRSFKAFIETVSCQAGELIWTSKAPTSLFDFIMFLQKKAAEEKRLDGMSLTYYSILLQFIRSLTEDWTTQGRSNLVQSDTNQRQQYANQVFQLLSALCDLLERENFAVMNSIRDCITIRFHRPLLESIMLCLDTLFTTTSIHSQEPFRNCITKLLPVICESFHVLVVKAGSYSAPGSSIPEDALESCIQDVTVSVSLLQSLVHPTYNINPDTWLAIFKNHNTIPSLIQLFYGGVELLVSEVEKQKSSYNISITPYAETALYFLMYLSKMPDAAMQLVEHGLFNAFCNNSLMRCLQQGQLDLFIRFGNSNKTGPVLVERNPLHSVWCLMLGVVGKILNTLPSNEIILNNAVNFTHVYGAQIGKAFDIANEINTSSSSPSESLSSPLLDEMQQIALLFFGLSQNLTHFKKVPVELFESFKDCSLILLQRYSYYMSHPNHLQARLYPVNNEEREQLKSSVSTTPNNNVNKLMIKTWDSILVISHYVITSLVMQTSTDEILTLEDTKWPFGNTILAPELNSSERGSASFGTLVEYISIGVNRIKEWANNGSYPVQPMLDVIQDCSVLLASQVALWVAKPGLKDEIRMEIASDNVKDIMDTLIKVEGLLKEESKKRESVELKSRSEVVKTLQVFLCKRFY